jgi:hypothetical protein
LAEETMSFRDVPRSLQWEACRTITDFSIGLVRVHKSRDGEKARIGGSGTLVLVDGIYGILTACHVLDYLRGHEVGLLLANMIEPIRQRVTVQSDAIRWVRIACSAKEGDGPDLGVLVLSSVEVGALSARKSFYNLRNREWVLHTPPSLDAGMWFLCGFADEATRARGPAGGFGRVTAFNGACGHGWVDHQYRVGDFDYLDFEVGYGGRNEPPRDFGGFSGGGLWQVRVERVPEGNPKVKDVLLSGVAFYQNAPVGNRRVIRCHGRNGIYAHTILRVRDEAS